MQWIVESFDVFLIMLIGIIPSNIKLVQLIWFRILAYIGNMLNFYLSGSTWWMEYIYMIQ